jgi:leader peptidase (prepilin peptidase)/N-methyltransferase
MLLFEVFAALWFFAFGAVIGSFLNVVVWRTPRGESIVGPSRCPKCGTAIRWYNNVPVFGWMWLGGKCRDCKLPISPRYPVVEFICGAMFLAVALAEFAPPAGASREGGFVNTILDPHWPRIATFALHLLLLCALLAWALMQVDEQRIPPRQFSALWCVGLIAAVVLPALRLPEVESLHAADAVARASRGAMRAVAGFFTGVGVALPLVFLAWLLQRASWRHGGTFAMLAASSSVGLTLGPEGALIVGGLAMLLCGMSFFVSLLFAPLRHVPLAMEIFVATLVYLCLAERLAVGIFSNS